MYLLDTNVLSELRKGPRINAGVSAFMARSAADRMYLSVIVVGDCAVAQSGSGAAATSRRPHD